MVANDPFDLLGDKPEPVKPKKLKKTVKSSDVSKDTEISESTTKKTEPKKATKKKTTRKTKKKRRTRKSSTRKRQQVKRGSTITAKWFFIGCGVFFLIFLGLMIGGMYWILQSNQILQSTGLDAANVKTLLFVFSGLFFGILTLGLLFWLFLSIYRLATKKGGKLKYILGVVAALILLILVAIAWIYAITEIRKIRTITLSKNLVISYIQTKDGPIPAEQGLPLIAPMQMSFGINTASNATVASEIARSIANKKPFPVSLDCGNGQILSMNAQGGFNGTCLFMEKKEYPFTLRLDKGDGIEEHSALGIIPQAVIDVDPIDDEAYFNDNQNEYIVGVAPVDVRFKSELLFSDLNLADDEILWDFDADNSVDYTNQASFQHTFDDSRLHTVSYRLPKLSGATKLTSSKSIQNNDVWFQFDLRVVESELAKCTLSKENVRDTRWKFTPSFDENLQISDYRYTIYDLVNEEVLGTPKADARGVLSYNLPEGAKYEISMTYFTKDKQKGVCKPIEVNEGYQGNVAEFDLYRKHELDDLFAKVTTKTDEVSISDEGINSKLVPTSFQIQILRTVPDPDVSTEMYFNGRPILSDTTGVYEFEVSKEGVFDLEMVHTTKEGAVSNQVIPVSLSRSSVKALLEVSDDNFVGEDPHTVELDASISPLYDEDDEIVYFDWDFGDGEIKRKVSQGKVSHTYTFDAENDTGEFYPSVTVHTRKGFEDTYKLPEPVVVKRAQRDIEIFMDSHPQQQARVGETVRMSVRTDGLIDSIERDFGNFKTLTCDSRECASGSVVYTEPGIYDIKVEVGYEDNIPSVKTLKIQVF